MSRLARSCRALVVGMAAAAATLSMTQVASAAAPDQPRPVRIAVPAGNKVFLVGHAKGVQIYPCNNGVWGTASTPRATLFDDKGKFVATHFPGRPGRPRTAATSWDAGRRGERTQPRPHQPAIQWLLLSPNSTAPGPKGGDEFVKTTYIQRVNTNGGVAPTSCTGTDAVEVEYTPTTTSGWRVSRT